MATKPVKAGSGTRKAKRAKGVAARGKKAALPPSPGETSGNLAARGRWFSKRRET
jgi:hypothetical protein